MGLLRYLLPTRTYLGTSTCRFIRLCPYSVFVRGRVCVLQSAKPWAERNNDEHDRTPQERDVVERVELVPRISRVYDQRTGDLPADREHLFKRTAKAHVGGRATRQLRCGFDNAAPFFTASAQGTRQQAVHGIRTTRTAFLPPPAGPGPDPPREEATCGP